MTLLALFGIAFSLAVLLYACKSEESGAVSPPSDPLNGTWSGDWAPAESHRNPATVELEWDGASLSGTVNPGPDAVHDAKRGDFKIAEG